MFGGVKVASDFDGERFFSSLLFSLFLLDTVLAVLFNMMIINNGGCLKEN